MAPLLFLSFFLLLSATSSTLAPPPPNIGLVHPPPPPPPDPTRFHVGFYNTSCPHAESVIRFVVRKHIAKDPSIAAGLLRMLFHDCFVGGCDASLLLQPTNGVEAEQSAPPNSFLRGFDIIDEAKAAVEAVCPSTVSCADIVALAARDAVALSGGLDHPMPTGRRDSLEPNLIVMIPAAEESVIQVYMRFARKGLTPEDLVVLLGAHTVGRAHCNSLRGRLFHYRTEPGRGPDKGADPNMDAGLRDHLIKYCVDSGERNESLDKAVNLDLKTPYRFDNHFYKQVLDAKAILQLDQALMLDKTSAPIIATLASDGALFLHKFADALVKLASVQVLIGNDGEIRKNCSAPNKPASLQTNG